MVTTSWAATVLTGDGHKPHVLADRCQLLADRDLERRLMRFLYHNGLDGIRDLRIEADRGRVSLAGFVRSASQRARCLECCQRVAGVVRVIDRMESAPANSIGAALHRQ